VAPSRSAKKRAARKQRRAAGMDCSNLPELDDAWADDGPSSFFCECGWQSFRFRWFSKFYLNV